MKLQVLGRSRFQSFAGCLTADTVASPVMVVSFGFMDVASVLLVKRELDNVDKEADEAAVLVGSIVVWLSLSGT